MEIDGIEQVTEWELHRERKRKMASPGRPIKYHLNSEQVRKIKRRIASRITSKEICKEFRVHPFAVLRVRRALRAEA